MVVRAPTPLVTNKIAVGFFEGQKHLGHCPNQFFFVLLLSERQQKDSLHSPDNRLTISSCCTLLPFPFFLSHSRLLPFLLHLIKVRSKPYYSSSFKTPQYSALQNITIVAPFESAEGYRKDPFLVLFYFFKSSTIFLSLFLLPSAAFFTPTTWSFGPASPRHLLPLCTCLLSAPASPRHLLLRWPHKKSLFN